MVLHTDVCFVSAEWAVSMLAHSAPTLLLQISFLSLWLTDTEPGHIPGSISMPFNSFLSSTGHFLPKEQLQALFARAGVDLSHPVCALCGSGVTACHVALAAQECGNTQVSVYDGAWSEWYTRAEPENVISEGRGKHL